LVLTRGASVELLSLPVSPASTDHTLSPPGLCFPDFSDRGPIDFRDFYYRNHRWFFGLFALLMVLISLRDILFRAVPWISQGNAVKAGVLVIALVGVISSRPWIHAILALLGAIAILAAFFTFGLAYG